MRRLVRRFMPWGVPLVLVTLLPACSSTLGDLETMERYLDNAQYEKAIVLGREVLAKEANNYDAMLLLASALMGRGYFGEGNNFLGVFANFLEGRRSGSSDLQSIKAATPSTAEERGADVFEAVDLVAAVPVANMTQEHWLQLGFARLAVISIVAVLKIGAADTDDPCAMNFAAVTADEETRLNDALTNVNTNFEDAGIDGFGDSDLGQQITTMKTNLDAALTLQAYLQSEFGTCTP